MKNSLKQKTHASSSAEKAKRKALSEKFHIPFR